MHSLVVIIMWQWTSSHSENHYRIEHDRPSGIRFCVMLTVFWFMIIHCSLYGCCHGCHVMLLTVFHWQYHCDICDICDAWLQWHHHGHKETASEYSTMVTPHQKHSLCTGQYNPISHNSTYPWPLSVVRGTFFVFRSKVKGHGSKGQRSRVTSGSFFCGGVFRIFFVVTTSGSFFVLTTSGSFFVVTTSGSFFVVVIH